jgi:hypothetical protein
MQEEEKEKKRKKRRKESMRVGFGGKRIRRTLRRRNSR